MGTRPIKPWQRGVTLHIESWAMANCVVDVLARLFAGAGESLRCGDRRRRERDEAKRRQEDAAKVAELARQAEAERKKKEKAAEALAAEQSREQARREQEQAAAEAKRKQAEDAPQAAKEPSAEPAKEPAPEAEDPQEELRRLTTYEDKWYKPNITKFPCDQERSDVSSWIMCRSRQMMREEGATKEAAVRGMHWKCQTWKDVWAYCSELGITHIFSVRH